MTRRKQKVIQGICVDCKAAALDDSAYCEHHREYHRSFDRARKLRKYTEINVKRSQALLDYLRLTGVIPMFNPLKLRALIGARKLVIGHYKVSEGIQ